MNCQPRAISRTLCATFTLWIAAVLPAQKASRNANSADLDAALAAMPKDAVAAIYAQKKKVNGKPVRVSDYVSVDKVGTASLRKNLHRTDKEFAKQRFLDCTTFATPVLHRIVRGTFAGFAQTKVNDYGDQVAASHRLKEKLSTSTKAAIKLLRDRSWRSKHEGLYFFNLRKGVLGHIGFAVVTKQGTRHVHMSRDKKSAGWRDEGDFAKYLKATTYNHKHGTVQLFRVVAPKK